MLVPHGAMGLHVSCDCGVSLVNLGCCLFALLFVSILFLFCIVLVWWHGLFRPVNEIMALIIIQVQAFTKKTWF